MPFPKTKTANPLRSSPPCCKEKQADAAPRAMRRMSEAAERAGVSDMSLDEINAEIAAARAERHMREIQA